jgi:type VI secretion system protein ImpK
MDATHSPAALEPLARFRAFWAELDAAIEDVRARRWAPSLEPVGAGGAAVQSVAQTARDTGRAVADGVFRRLRDAILTHGGAPPPKLAYGRTPIDLGYIMAALADETLLYLESWDGVEYWSRTLLEEGIYGTRIAGERIFEEIDEQLGRQNSVPEEVGIGLLLALALGFRGKYRLLPAVEAEMETDKLRVRLYRAIFYRAPAQKIDWRDTMGYPPAFQAGRLERLPRISGWIAAIVVVLIVYVFFAHMFWLSSLADLLSRADTIANSSPLPLN